MSAQDFVAEHNIRTVFGLGGSYLNGSFVTVIIFTRETIEQSKVESFMSLVNTFKSATMNIGSVEGSSISYEHLTLSQFVKT